MDDITIGLAIGRYYGVLELMIIVVLLDFSIVMVIVGVVIIDIDRI